MENTEKLIGGLVVIIGILIALVFFSLNREIKVNVSSHVPESEKILSILAREPDVRVKWKKGAKAWEIALQVQLEPGYGYGLENIYISYDGKKGKNLQESYEGMVRALKMIYSERKEWMSDEDRCNAH